MGISAIGSIWLVLVLFSGPIEGRDEPLAAVFHALMELHTWPAAEYLCLGIAAGSGEGWQLQDPPRTVVKSFEGHAVPVVPVSECEVTVEGNRHSESDRPAQAFWVESADLTALSGEVRARYHVDGLYGGSVECGVLKGPDGWEANCEQVGVS